MFILLDANDNFHHLDWPFEIHQVNKDFFKDVITQTMVTLVTCCHKISVFQPVKFFKSLMLHFVYIQENRTINKNITWGGSIYSQNGNAIWQETLKGPTFSFPPCNTWDVSCFYCRRHVWRHSCSALSSLCHQWSQTSISWIFSPPPPNSLSATNSVVFPLSHCCSHGNSNRCKYTACLNSESMVPKWLLVA